MTTTKRAPTRPVRPAGPRKPRMTEAALQEAVLRLARLCGWEAYHPYDSRKSAPGFPDTTLVRPPRIIFAELKVGGNRLSPAQVRWLGRLGGVPGVEVFVWTDRDWLNGEVDRVLQ